MADFHALEALINAYIKQNGIQAITGQVLNGVLRGMVSALGKGWTVAGQADPTTDPGTMTGPVAYIAHEAGTYTHFGGLVVDDGEVAFLKYNEQVWTKEVLASLAATASVDGNVGTPYVETQFVNGVLTFAFHNMKGNPGVDGTDGQDGDAAGFGTVNATVDANVGTPGVSVQSSGPNTAKNFTFAFTNLKGETGVTSAVVTVDNTSGTPQCAVSLVGQELHLDFTGLKGAQGNPGSSVDYPFTLVNNLTTNDATQALTAAMGVQLESEITQLEAKKADKDTVRANMMTDRAKYALLDLFNKVAFAVPDVSAEVAELNTALFNLDEVVGVEATYDQGKTIWDQGVSSLDDLKVDLTVKAVYGDGTKVKIQNYTLSGTLTAGTSTITVGYMGFIDTFDVTVTVYGSKTSYVLSKLQNLVGKAPDNSSTTYGWVLTNNAARQMALLDYGIQQIRNSDESESGYYPIPIPKTATKLTVAITQNTLQIGGYLMWFDGVKLKLHNSTVYSWTAGGFTATFTQDGDRQVYYVPVSKPSSGNYPSGQPTALTINFE